ncbi:MAG: hypothetical protein C0506_09175 [Anaerolinea sp.]|nr:hypothetical protein [Anaerolinea sp.]
MESQVDALDKKIILSLFRDARASYKSIATTLGVSHNTVRSRIARMLAEKIIRFVVVTDPPKVGLSVTAFIRIVIQPEFIESVGAALSARKEVGSIYQTIGDCDTVCLAHFESNAQLFRFVNNFVARLPGVSEVKTTIISDVVQGLPDRQVPVASIQPPDEGDIGLVV